MRVYREIGLGILTILLLASCSSTDTQQVYSGSEATNTGQEPAQTQMSEEERQRVLTEQRALAEERARQDEARRQEEEARRMAEAREAEREAEQAREREREETARRDAERQRQLANQRAAEQARIVAAQRARIEELRAQIAANEAETGNLEAANASLRQAIAAAEELTEALMAEEEKYSNTDPATGQTTEELATSTLDELAEQVQQLKSQAEAAMAKP